MSSLKCKFKEELFSRILSDDDIEINQQDKLHFESCEECRSYLHEIQNTENELLQEKNRILKVVPVPTIASLIEKGTVAKKSVEDKPSFFDSLKIFKLSLSLAFVLVAVFVFKPTVVKTPSQLGFVLASGKIYKSFDRILKCSKNEPLPRRIKLQVKDNAVIKVNGKIKVTFEKSNFSLFKSEIKLINGKVTAEVFKEGTRFAVSTPNARFRDIGTKFSVVFNKKSGSLLKVFSGEVWINTKISESYVAAKGEEILVDPDGKISPFLAPVSNKPANVSNVKVVTPPTTKTSFTNSRTNNSSEQDNPNNPNKEVFETKSATADERNESCEQNKTSFMDSVLSTE